MDAMPAPVRRFAATALALALLLPPGAADAHGVGTSEVALVVDGAHATGTWSLNLRDARKLAGLDPSVTGDAGFAELRAHEPALRAAIAGRVALAADGGAAQPLALEPAPLEWRRDLDDVRFHVAATFAAPPRRLGIHDELLFDADASHRAYFSIEDDRVTSVGVLRAWQRGVTVDVHQFHAFATAAEFVREGVRHIWTGADHLLFLIALLLPAALLGPAGGWRPRPGLAASAREVAKVVTAFTLAHSVTLSLSFFRVVTPPAAWVETGIALSVFAAAWNNLRPFLPGRAWWMALAFGLVHGLGFAGALNNLSLPRHARVLALGAFNVGVELGQLAIVAVALPLLYAASRHRAYPRLVMGAGSLGIAWLAIVWALERGAGLALLPVR
jgi:hypothetical protein